MTPALALSALLSLPAMQAHPAGVTAIQPRFHMTFQPGVSRSLQHDDREIVCGMVVIHKTPTNDPKILLPRREPGAAVRRIAPPGCGANASVSAK
jgi:hypothetical protein